MKRILAWIWKYGFGDVSVERLEYHDQKPFSNFDPYEIYE
jgi:hypothetical protein